MSRIHRLASRFLASAMLLLGALCISSPTAAQLRSNFGKEFYVAFAQNQGGAETDNLMALFITSRVPASGVVSVPYLNYSINFTTTPGQISEIMLPSDQTVATVEMTLSEIAYTGGGVHITADQDIAVFGMNHKLYSSDAFMAMPVDVLGTTYRSINFPSSTLGGSETAGEFWFVATQDHTTVHVTPKAATVQNIADKTFDVALDRGDSYLVQGIKTDATNDLTGSLITSDKPIAFFSGHTRAAVPTNAVNIDGSVSRDHLCEQIPPMGAWGDSVIVAPFLTSASPDLVRVVASTDGTIVKVNDAQVATINAGQFYELAQVLGPTLISASQPILVGQYMHTSWGALNDANNPAYGDPALALVLPVEQFYTDYTIIADQNAAFTGNFVNIIVESGELPAIVFLDSVKIPSDKFQPIPNSNYKYAQIPITQGTHRLFSQDAFGLTVYALGPVDSYAYTGGALVKNLNALAVSAPRSIPVGITNLHASNNPFGDQTTIAYQLDKPTSVRLELVDELGRAVDLEIHGHLEAGTHTVKIDGRDLPNGFYYLRLITSEGASGSLRLQHVK